jgi:hypothetical protein
LIGLVLARMVYLFATRVLAWLVAGPDVSVLGRENAEILILRHEAALLRRQIVSSETELGTSPKAR